MPSSSTTAVTTERVLHASPARTVVERTDAQGQRVVCKIYVAGSLAEAEREFARGAAARGPGVVEHLAAGLDAASNRPCVTTRREHGADLDRLVGEQGAVPAALACAWLAPVAATLARLHGLRTATAPAGLVHGDVKPKNLLRTTTTTLLLDFEHSQPVAAAGGARAAFGTVGFQAPEAAQATAASPALDVYALGATLAWLLAGGGEPVPQSPRVERLLAACMHADAARRPPAAAVADELQAIAVEASSDDAEAILQDWATANLRLPTPQRADDPRIAPWRSRQRLLQRLPGLMTAPHAVPVEPGPLLAALTMAQRLLQRFPRHAGTLRWRQDLLQATGQQLAAAPQQVATHQRLEAFAAAATWIDALAELTAFALGLPGGLRLAPDEASPPGMLHRQPLAFLQRLRDQIAAADAELRDELAGIAAAERDLDLRAAEAAIDAMAAHRGGTSPTAARQRDRLHRLGFYLDRVARAEANVERVAALWDATALRPLTAFVGVAVASSTRSPRHDSAAGSVGLRSLQLTLINLAEEFPHLPQVAPALEALTEALAHLTDQAWQMLAEARGRFAAVPVPVRPLQLTLGRLDTFRVLEAFLDRPERPRSQLLDQIESLRLALEQARATRDRLAASAENALARGHWTTGLFDMERAVAGLEPTDDREQAEATRLQERLQEARRRKAEVETKVRRNVELASTYGMLQDDPGSSFATRLQVLEERRGCLLFLTMHVPADRSVLYQRDLRDIDTQIALERADLAEHQLDGTVEPHDRLRLARATLEQLSQSVTQSEQGIDPPGRVVRLLEHWRTATAHCQRTVDELAAATVARARQRRRTLLFLAAAVVATTTAIAFAVRPWLAPSPTMAAPSERGR